MNLFRLRARVRSFGQPVAEVDPLWRYHTHARFTVTLRNQVTGEMCKFRRRDGCETKGFGVKRHPRRILSNDLLRIDRAIKSGEAAQR